jgi:hypothetical protein
MRELDDVLFFAGWARGLLKLYMQLPPNRQKQIKAMVEWIDDERKTLEDRKSAARGIYNMALNWAKEE